MKDAPLPKAIQAELDAAEEIEKQLKGNTEAPAPAENTEVDPPAEPQAEPAPEPIASAPAQESWETKYKVLMGKYNSEVPVLAEENRTMRGQIQDLTRKVEDLLRAPEPEPKKDLVTPKDEETFGGDLIDLARRVTRDEVMPVLARLSSVEAVLKQLSKLPDAVTAVTERQAHTAEELFWGAVISAVPEWDQIDKDPRWIEFLETAPEFSKRTYRDLATDAIAAADPNPIVAMVKVWKQKVGIVEPPKNDKTNKELQSQTAPPKATAATPTPPAQKTWTGTDYANAYDVRLNRTMSDADVEKLQAEAEQALADGRVDWSR